MFTNKEMKVLGRYHSWRTLFCQKTKTTTRVAAKKRRKCDEKS